MSIIKVNPADIETFSVITNPTRTYSSSSLEGANGSVYVFARRSQKEKEMAPLPAFIDSTYSDEDLNSFLSQVKSQADANRAISSSDPSSAEIYNQKFHSLLEQYLDKVNKQGVSARKFKALDIIRFTPTSNFTSNTLRKLVVKDILNKYYRVSYPTAHWGFTNYNTLNFFTSPSVPESSALIFPNIENNEIPHEGYVNGVYNLSGAFSFDFYINPRYQQQVNDSEFKAGTIFHLSSSYAVSLITGSAKDENGKSTAFRLQLQLSHSADISPSAVVPGNFPSDLVFRSDDNSLSWNKWHHVVIRWGTNLINDGTGSFNIDGIDRGLFSIPSGTISPLTFNSLTQENPSTLIIGNYWEGTNKLNSAQSIFFSEEPSEREGLVKMNDLPGVVEPEIYSFNHPLNAELHDLCIKRYYMANQDIFGSASKGLEYLDNKIALYVPPFFVEESPFRKSVNGSGGILQTPFFEIDGTTNDPFNVAMSFGVNGHLINLENYVRDFANDTYPRLHHLSGTVITESTLAKSANEFLYDDPFIKKRNLTILPCDDGNFIPNYSLIANESKKSKFVGDDNVEDLSLINLDNLLSTTSLIFGTSFEDVEGLSLVQGQDFNDELIGFSPENVVGQPGSSFMSYKNKTDKSINNDVYDPGIQADAPLAIYQRTKDPSSNQVTFFDISNLYYGKQIKPGSFMITDMNMTGSGGRFGITLKDDGRGNLYRADSLTPHSTWNSCGNIFYNEGIVVIKNPHLYFYGKESFYLSFKGEQNIHTLKIEVVAPQNMLNSSSNPSFKQVPASGMVTDNDPNFVYITGLNFHDENLNVVAKTQLAQPILKRHGDRIMFKVTFDV
jgi:hypothetical protein